MILVSSLFLTLINVSPSLFAGVVSFVGPIIFVVVGLEFIKSVDLLVKCLVQPESRYHRSVFSILTLHAITALLASAFFSFSFFSL
jgi:hypothetical protein